MADCPKPYYCYILPTYTVGGGCDEPELYQGGIQAIGILSCGTEVTDPSDAAEIQALLDAGSLTIITDIKASLDKPSAITIDPVTACGGPITISADRTVTLSDAKVSQTIMEFYNEATSTTGVKFGGLLLWECAVDRVSYVDAQVSFFGGRNIPNNNGEVQSFNGTFTWRTALDPIPYPAPAGIFN